MMGTDDTGHVHTVAADGNKIWVRTTDPGHMLYMTCSICNETLFVDIMGHEAENEPSHVRVPVRPYVPRSETELAAWQYANQARLDAEGGDIVEGAEVAENLTVRRS